MLYRNTNRIQESGGRKAEVLHPVAGRAALGRPAPAAKRCATPSAARTCDAAERTFAALAAPRADDAFNDLLFAVQDNTEVHRVVLPYRAWDLLGLIGREHAHTLLRQSVRYCVKSERDWQHTPSKTSRACSCPSCSTSITWSASRSAREPPTTPGSTHEPDDLRGRRREQAAEAVAAALAEGFAPDAIGEAISLAANQLVLRDAGRTAREVQPGKPLGSVHGDSIGVHACDSANAWRNMARVSNPRNTVACLILGAYQVAYDRVNRGGDFLHWSPRPLGADLEPIKDIEPDELLPELRRRDPRRRPGPRLRGHRTGSARSATRPARCSTCCSSYAVSEDGALHAEKYYRTVSEEFASTRPAFRWRQLVRPRPRHRQRVRPPRRRHRRGPRAAADRLTSFRRAREADSRFLFTRRTYV